MTNIELHSDSSKPFLQGDNSIRIIIAGGGTGGHIFPAIAIANAIKNAMPKTEFLFVGAKGKMEMEKIPQAGYKIIGIDIAGFNRSSLLKNISLPIKLAKSFIQVRKIINEFKPNAVIGVGGYSTYPVLRYAQVKKIPTFIHESNSFAGKSNKLLGKKATKVFVATDGMEKFFAKEKLIITGNPVRNNISDNTVSKNDAIAFFGLADNKKTVLVIGGSLGAKSINETIHDNIGVFENNNLQVIWQTGKEFKERAKLISADYKNVYTIDFITKMENAFAAADVVISRAGAMAIAEICSVGKPAVLVPYPFAAEDHQTVNATHLVEKNAAIMVKDNAAKSELITAILELAKDETKQKKMQLELKKLATKNADEIIANEVLAQIIK
jgi:UDP-N-acetylglucosamine--N-acetylmuramyl-(pentapeptide) pyrophosphoryl-undecaprenol N-acetylglucosamine transferase